jgi:hypothetical protein
MRRVKRLLLPAFLAATLTATPLAAQAPDPSKPDVGQGLKRERERLANYQWRLRTEMRVDGTTRMSKVEDVHLGPDGGLVKKTVKFEKSPEPTPYAPNDPRARVHPPPTSAEDDRLSEIAQDLMQYYLRLSPERVAEWAKRAEILPGDADHPGLVRMHGRGLGRPLDDAVLYLDPKTQTATQIEVKTTVDPRILDIAFIRATFEALQQARTDVAPLWIPKRVFLNMNRGRRAVALEMETSDWRSWP